MKKIQSRVEAFIRGDYYSPPFLSPEWLLQQAAVIYRQVMKARYTLYRKDVLPSRMLPCTVISVGNITAGGTGKTPMTIYIARFLKDMGFKTAVISRGYRGGLERDGGVVSDGSMIFFPPHEAGDEPYLMAKQLNVPVVVGRNRYRAGMKAVRLFTPDVIILDDAFQHLKIKRDLDIVLLDNFRPFGNERTLPAGILREGLSALGRGDIFIMTRSDRPVDSSSVSQLKRLRERAGKRPVFNSSHKTRLTVFSEEKSTTVKCEGHGVSELLKNRRCFLFSGLGNNRQFRQGVEALGGVIEDHLEFTDHHRYIPRDLERVKKGAGRSDADLILTTEKDYVKIPETESWGKDMGVLGIEASFEKDGELRSEIMKCVLKTEHRQILSTEKPCCDCGHRADGRGV